MEKVRCPYIPKDANFKNFAISITKQYDILKKILSKNVSNIWVILIVANVIDVERSANVINGS